jgi:hypothetical protein
MVFFNRLAKNLSPVKIIIKFEYFYVRSIKPSISQDHSLLQNEWIPCSVPYEILDYPRQ